MLTRSTAHADKPARRYDRLNIIIIYGRPCGGTGIMYNKSLGQLVTPIDTNIQIIIFNRPSGFVTAFAITKKLSARRPLLFEDQRVTSPRLPWLRRLIAPFSTYCH